VRKAFSPSAYEGWSEKVSPPGNGFKILLLAQLSVSRNQNMSGQQASLVFSDSARALSTPIFNPPSGNAAYFVRLRYLEFSELGAYVPVLMTPMSAYTHLLEWVRSLREP